MEIVYNIEEAVKRSATGEKICWGLTKENRWDIFKICYFQFRYQAKDEFKCISYEARKDWFYYWLRLVSILSFGHYRVLYRQM